MVDVLEYKRDDSLDYLKVLEALKEIPFPVGKTLLIDFLTGNYKNSSITNNDLDSLNSFDSFEDENKLSDIIENLINNNLIEITNIPSNRFIKVLKLTKRGENELKNPSLFSKQLKNNFTYSKTIITEEDKIKFNELKIYLNYYNDEQKKAIISDKKNILCIAGAGSGKTTVLTKRIEFLVKFKSVNPEKILAITFTRKAKEEMRERLLKLSIQTNVETFNSFCEKILKKYESIIYGRNIKVMSYGNKVMAMMFALSSLNLTMSQALDKYFSPQQKRNKTSEELSNILMNDCFFILDYFKTKNQELYDFSKEAELDEREIARLVFNICKKLKENMNLQGLRDYTDQILDVLRFLNSNSNLTPQFEHILIDEYQDVNAMQTELIDILNPNNLFCVGDPRQSIFGWRGSDINYILKFKEKYPDSEIISLTKNYRSNRHIVNFMNHSIKYMGLPDLIHNYDGKKEIQIQDFERESDEMDFVINKILESNMPLDQIFILSRTNSQLVDISKLMKQKSIPFIIKSDEIKSFLQSEKTAVTLATIHAIKGLEARMVFIIGCNELNFPCKASDHPVIELIKVNNYDKEEEEKRLFYVAISRAKHKLFLTYTGKKPTYFINKEMMKIIEE